MMNQSDPNDKTTTQQDNSSGEKSNLINIINPPLMALKQAVFPIYMKEMPKFIPMALLNFLTLFSFTMLRNTKDSLVLLAPNMTSLGLTYAKLGLVLPASILFSIIYIKIRNNLGFQRTYHVVMTFFVMFFLIFNYILYPLADYIHPDPEVIHNLQLSLPAISNFFGLAGVWSFSLYYVMSELWGTYTLSVLFWQFANENIDTTESKRFYPTFILIGNISLIFLSYVLKYVSDHYTGGAEINFINNTIFVCGVSMMLLFQYTNRYILSQEQYQPKTKIKKKKKQKLSLGDSMKVLFKSEYILYIAVIVLSYGIMINIFEVVWKDQLRLAVTNRNEFLEFMGLYTKYTGISTIALIYVSMYVIRKMGWLVGAIITPIMATVTCVIFFLYCLMADTIDPVLTTMGAGAMFSVMFGAAGVVMTKSSKYAFFDPTKEMSFIPLSDDLKASGKAAVDGVGARLGKSGGGLIQIFIAFIISSLTGEIVNAIDMIQYTIFIIILMGGAWVYSVIKLNRLYQAALLAAQEPNDEPNQEKSAAAPASS